MRDEEALLQQVREAGWSGMWLRTAVEPIAPDVMSEARIYSESIADHIDPTTGETEVHLLQACPPYGRSNDYVKMPTLIARQLGRHGRAESRPKLPPVA